MLAEQRPHLAPGKVAETQRTRLDVEGAATGDDGPLDARVDAVVAHVAHAAQDDALREVPRPVGVPCPELPEDRYQRIADQCVDLVEQQHERSGVGLRPESQQAVQRVQRPGRLQDPRPQSLEGVIAQGQPRLVGQVAENGAHRLLHVLARRLAGLHVDVHAAVLAVGAGVQEVAQGEQGGGLAGLPRRVENEVALVPHQREDVFEIHPLERRYAVVALGSDGARGVERAHLTRVWHGAPAFR